MWTSQQLPAPPPVNESMVVRDIKFKTRYTYQAPPLMRFGRMQFKQIVKQHYNPPVFTQSGYALYAATQLKYKYSVAPLPAPPIAGRLESYSVGSLIIPMHP